MRFEDPNNPDVVSFRLVEVYYENDTPHRWVEASLPSLEDYELPEEYTSLDVSKALAQNYLDFISKANSALHKPILDSKDFLSS